MAWRWRILRHIDSARRTPPPARLESRRYPAGHKRRGAAHRNSPDIIIQVIRYLPKTVIQLVCVLLSIVRRCLISVAIYALMAQPDIILQIVRCLPISVCVSCGLRLWLSLVSWCPVTLFVGYLSLSILFYFTLLLSAYLFISLPFSLFLFPSLYVPFSALYSSLLFLALSLSLFSFSPVLTNHYYTCPL